MTKQTDCPFRTGQGYDVHRLTDGRKLILGGVDIPYEKGLLGHSDADVCTHALMDAMLGAAGLGDIGLHFPDSDPAYKDISSLKLLEKVKDLVAAEGFVLVNADITIVAQAPKLRPFIPSIEEKLAKTLEVNVSQINVKATTEEGLGFTGTGEGISTFAVCLLVKDSRG
jgi:2-C-methyl-D-erythritol 2,4-cyclodiphosphate synthase